MRWRRRYSWIILLGVNLYLWLLVVFAGFDPEKCQGSNCSDYHPDSYLNRLLFPLRFALHFIGHNEPIVVGAGTVFLAVFTYLLFDATRSLVQGADDSIRRQMRAYVSFNGMTQQWGPRTSPVTGDFYEWRIRPSVINSGNTPTRDMRIYVISALRTYPIGEEVDLSGGFDPPPEIGAGGQIPPHGTIAGGSAPFMAALTPDDIADIIWGRSFFYVWGLVRYRDEFPDSPVHTTRFAWQITIVGNPYEFRPLPTPTTLSFNWIYRQLGNRSDDE